MNIGPLLKGPVHSGDQIDLVLESLQRLHRGSQLVERLDAEIRILLAKRFHHVAKVPLGNDVVGFARKEPAPDDTNRHIKMSHPLSGTLFAEAAVAMLSIHGSAKAAPPSPRRNVRRDVVSSSSSFDHALTSSSVLGHLLYCRFRLDSFYSEMARSESPV